jgi:hypothetical protein
MDDTFYWGEGGQYGPYHAQEDGWPNAGEVQRDYREQADLSADEFALLYSEELKKLGKENKKGKSGAEGKVSGTWVLNMEKQNRVPTDITRRRVIARLLHIPSLLLGLATLQDVEIQPQKEAQMQPAMVPHTLKKVSTDIGKYEPTSAIDALAEARIFNRLFDRSNERTVITVSHRLSTVEKADVIIMLEDGCVVETGTHRELVEKRGRYYRMFESQIK